MNCMCADASAHCCLVMPVGPYTGTVQFLKWDPAAVLSWVGQGCSGSAAVLSLQSLLEPLLGVTELKLDSVCTFS